MRPRFRDPGALYLVTRRCSQRQFLLRPDKQTTQGFLYCLAYALTKTSVRLHGFCSLSNHWHAVVSDPMGELPKFMHAMNHTLARYMNRLRSRWENFFDNQPYSAVRLLDSQAGFDKLIYTLANPVKAGLVKEARSWPGPISKVEELDGGIRVIQRPPKFFDKEGQMPEELSLKTVRLPGYAQLSHEKYLQTVDDALRKREVEIADTMENEGRRFLGRRGVRKQDPFDSPNSVAPRRKVSPQFASADPDRRVAAIQDYHERLAAYLERKSKFQGGDHKSPWPPGTYWLVVHFKQKDADPPRELSTAPLA